MWRLRAFFRRRDSMNKKMLCGLACALVFGGSAAMAQIRVQTTLERDTYYQGDRINFTISAYNDGDEDRTFRYGSAVQFDYMFDQVMLPETPEQFAGATVMTQLTIPAHGQRTWHVEGPKPAKLNGSIGQHVLYTRLLPDYVATPVTFTILPPTLPEEDFTVDFDQTLAGEPLQRLDQYKRWGIHFSSKYAKLVQDIRNGDDSFIKTFIYSWRQKPHNLRAKLVMPVEGLTVDVSSTAGTRVKVIARDADGKRIGSATSRRIRRPGHFVPLSIECDEPIAMLEWRSSDLLASVALDNLQLNVLEPVADGSSAWQVMSASGGAAAVPEPAGLGVLAAGALGLLRRRR